jgi:hypothetical protein
MRNVKRRAAICAAVVLALSCTGSAAAAPKCDPATNAQAIAEAREGLEKIRNFMSALGTLGVPVPTPLSNAVDRFGHAVEMGIDLGEAAGEADFQVQQIVSNRHRLCDLSTPDEDERWICYARIDRQWQARNVNAVLNWENTGSVIRRAVNKWMGSRCDRSEEVSLPDRSEGSPRDPRGVRIDVAPVGTTKDLSGVREDVLRLRKPGS